MPLDGGLGLVCSACDNENDVGAKFCSACGTALTLCCPGCGAPYRSGHRFCSECGTALAVAAAAASPAAPRRLEETVAPVSEPELRFVSVLFVDLVGFTVLSDGREAEDVRELLGSYFSAASTILERYGGLIEKFIGDAVMAVWGAAAANEDDAERAVRAGLEIVDAVGVFGAQVGAADLRARAGVVTGQVAAVERVAQGIVVGDRVNMASRVQSAAPSGGVLVDEVTRQVTSAAIAYEDAGEHAMKGKAEPVRLWRAVRVVSGVGGRDRVALEPPFVGRDAELRFLKDAVHATVERGAARLVVVSGEAGIGKSRIRRELLHYIDGLADTFLWHQGRNLAHGTGVAYWALAEMVRQRLGVVEDAPSEETAAKIEAGVQRWLTDPADRAYVLPRLGALLGVGEAALGRDELVAGWRLFFERLAAHAPVIMVFEDMQWADAGLLGFVEQLLDWATGAPILMVVLTRPELSDRGWPGGRRGATSLALEPLSDRAVSGLLTGLVDGLSSAAVTRIVAQAQGIPLYAVETVRSLIDRDLIIERDGRLTASDALDDGELEIPASLRALLSARLDALTPEEQTLVKAMAVYGGSFPRTAAAALSAVPEDRLDETLAALVRKQVLVIRADELSPDRGQYAFAQDLLRAAAYDRLARRERLVRHAAAARQLQSTFAHGGEEVAEVIATHLLSAYRAAGQDAEAEALRTEAVQALRRAGERSTTVGAPEAAERAYATAVELADPAEQPALLQLAGEMAVRAGRLEAAVALLEQAIARHDAAGDVRATASAVSPLAFALGRLGRYGEAVARITDALAALPNPDRYDVDRGRLHAALGRAYALLGDHEPAVSSLEIALDVAQGLELQELLAESLGWRATMLMLADRVPEAHIMFAAVLELAERDDLPDVLATANGNAGNLGMLYDLPDARGQFETAVTLFRRRGDRYSESLHMGNLMYLDMLAGRWAEIDQVAHELLTADPERPGATDLQLRLGLLQALRGDAPACAVALSASAGWEHGDSAEERGLYAALAAANALAADRPLDALQRGLGMLTDGLPIEAVRELWPTAYTAALRLGRHPEAERLLHVLSQRPVGHLPPYLRAHLARGRALLHAVTGAREAAIETDLRDAAGRFAALGYPYWLAVTRTDLAAWLIDHDAAEAASELLTEAIRVLDDLGATPALARARAVAASAGRPVIATVVP